jgi:excinuclease UvrABC nuclease subunit
VALAEDLPSAVGVYVMRDEHGRALRVGSAGNIRRRVRGYFTSAKRQGRLMLRALESVDRVDHEVTGSEFEADLRAHRLVTDLAPTCNRPVAGTTSRRYLRLSVSDAGVRISAVARASRAGEHFGPLGAERSARMASEALQVLLPVAADGGVAPADACRRVLGDDPIVAAEELALLVDRAARAGALLDFNHPLAGQPIRFEVRILGVL